MAQELLLAAAGLVLLAVAADQLVIGAARVAERARVSSVAIGVLVIGLGTSAPEFLVSGLAAARGDLGLAVANMAGSNVLNLTLVLGIAALIRPVTVRAAVIRREAPLTVASMLVFAVAVGVGIGRVAGIALAAVLLIALWVLMRSGEDPVLAAEIAEFTEEAAEAGERRPSRRTVADALRAAGGLAGVLLGAQILVTNAVVIAAGLGVSQTLIGFTLVAGGTSLPELVTAAQAQRRGESDLLVGNLLGSNLFNSLGGGAVIGLAAAGPVSPAGPHGPIRVGVLVVMVAVGVLGWAMVRRGHRVTRGEGAVLLVIYAGTVPLLL